MKKYMSVKEMGDLLGIKKTDRYWLLKKGYFKVVTIAGKMWVDTASFEDWYAHQVKYRKITGERSENEIRELSYSPKEAAALLGVSEWLIYELIKSRHLKTIKVDGWTRILKDDFYAWYAKQDRYQIIERKGEIRKKQPEEGASVKSIPVEEVAVLLGISNHEMHRVSEEYPDLLETIDVNGRACFTEKGLMSAIPLIIIVAREFMVSGLRLVTANEGVVVAAEVEAFLLSHQREAIGGDGSPGILEGLLPVILGGRHIRILDALVGKVFFDIVNQLPAAKGGEQLVSFGQGKIPNQRILQLPDDGVRLMVFKGRRKPYFVVLQRNGKDEGKVKRSFPSGIGLHVVAGDNEGVSPPLHPAFLKRAADLHFPLFRRVEVQPPQCA